MDATQRGGRPRPLHGPRGKGWQAGELPTCSDATSCCYPGCKSCPSNSPFVRNFTWWTCLYPTPLKEHTSELLIKAFDEAYNGNRGEGRVRLSGQKMIRGAASMGCMHTFLASLSTLTSCTCTVRSTIPPVCARPLVHFCKLLLLT